MILLMSISWLKDNFQEHSDTTVRIAITIIFSISISIYHKSF